MIFDDFREVKECREHVVPAPGRSTFRDCARELNTCLQALFNGLFLGGRQHQALFRGSKMFGSSKMA